MFNTDMIIDGQQLDVIMKQSLAFMTTKGSSMVYLILIVYAGIQHLGNRQKYAVLLCTSKFVFAMLTWT